jgi:YVTN family beta-propeller protein
MKTFALLKALASVSLVASEPGFAQNAYITNSGDNTISVIDTATNTVVGLPIAVGSAPFRVAVTSSRDLLGRLGMPTVIGKNLSALAQTFGGLNAVAIALGFPTVQALQTAVSPYCGG